MDQLQDLSTQRTQAEQSQSNKLSIRSELRHSILQRNVPATPLLQTPKLSTRESKNLSIGVSKPRNLEPINSVSPPINLSLSPNTTIGKKEDNSEFLVQLYKNPGSKSEVFSKSFVSFRSLADMQKKQPESQDLGESFLPSYEAPSWKSKLDQNKQQESLFKSTIQDMFRKSQSNFSRLMQDDNKRKVMMPRVRVYTNSGFFKSDKAKTAQTEGDAAEDNEEAQVVRQEEKIPEYETRIRLAKDEPYKFYIKVKDDQTVRKPNAREGATLTVMGKKVYLFGGVSREPHNEWEVLNPENFLWEKLPPKGDIPPFGRLGHSADAYMNAIVIFGGEKSYNTVLKLRECLSDVRLYLTNTNEWKYIKTQGEFVEPRRNHVGVVVGRHLIVHGGIDSQGNYLSDTKVLNISTGRWSQIEEKDKDNTGIAFHRACVVLSMQRKEVNFYKMPELKFDDTVQQVKEEGIYFFGGKTEVDEPVNTLRILKVGSSPFKWITPVTQGKSPSGRFFHTMVHCRRFNMLIVHGGRNDGHHSIPGQPNMGDFHVLQLENWTWVTVVPRGMMQAPRCSHTAVMMGTKMIIFGGIQYNTYCAPDPIVVELDQKMVKELEIKDKLKKGERRDTEVFESKRAMMHDRNYDGMVSFLPVPAKQNHNNRILKEISPKVKKIASPKHREVGNFEDY